MKKILIQIDSDKIPSSFDSITAIDSGVDHILSYGGVLPGELSDIVYGAMFTRGESDLKNSAVFIGGSNVTVGELMLKETLECFFDNTRISVMMDANGCNTTAAAAVRKILSCGNIKGKNVTVLGGTGPVGMRAAGLLAREGAIVTITSRNPEKANDTCEVIAKRFDAEVTSACVNGIDEADEIIGDSYAVLSAGTIGVTMLSESGWKNNPSIKVLADVNAVPPFGIDGIKPHWSAKEKEGKLIFGSIGIGGLKMKVHRECISLLFEQNDMVLDAEGIYNVASRLN
ncbi:MAG: methylenetetrahydromethanopterin dehydrogenase [Deltaproteobacteria bacterium]|nr:methylenetetrahydromethanopterin dehydrogenase [Deltaproteobacteria bacterium]